MPQTPAQEARPSKFESYVVKGQDVEREVIAEIVARSTEVVVYFVKGGYLKLDTSAEVPPERDMPIIREYDSVHRLIVKAIPRWSAKEFKRQLGGAIFSALSDKRNVDAVDHIKEIRANVEEYGQYFAKRYYLLSGLLVLLFEILLIVWGNAFGFDFPGPGVKYFEGAFWASIGAAASVCLRAGRLQLEPELATWHVAAFQGALRMIVGALFGVIFVAAVYGDLLLGAIKDKAAAMIAFSILSGFSESFVPEFLAKTEKAKPGEG